MEDQVRNPSYAFSGKTTEFDDVLIKHGIITKEQALLNKGMEPEAVADLLIKEKLTEMGFFDAPEVEHLSAAEERAVAIEQAKGLEGLDELEEEDEFGDDGFLQKFREARLAELKASRAANVFGTVNEITKADWMREVNEASKGFWVVCHLYADHVDECQVMHGLLARFAAKFRAVKVLRIVSRQAVENYPDDRTPGLFCYRDGELQHQLVTMRQDGLHGLRTRDGDLEWWLAAKGVVATDLEAAPPPPTLLVSRDDGISARAVGNEAAVRSSERRFVNGGGGGRRRGAGPDDSEDEEEEDVDEYGR
jgi:hypothetical protein